MEKEGACAHGQEWGVERPRCSPSQKGSASGEGIGNGRAGPSITALPPANLPILPPLRSLPRRDVVSHH